MALNLEIRTAINTDESCKLARIKLAISNLERHSAQVSGNSVVAMEKNVSAAEGYLVGRPKLTFHFAHERSLRKH